MPSLTLKFKANVIKEFDLTSGNSLSIGRRDTNDIVIENLAVSGYHAKVDHVDDGYLLTDLQSKNGTFVAGKSVTAYWLKNEDVVTIGKHTVIFAYKDGEEIPAQDSEPEPEPAPEPDTEPEQDPEPESKAAPEPGEEVVISPDEDAEADAKQEDEAGVQGVLTFLAALEGEMELTRKIIKIGKDDSNDIVVGGLMMGATAATISKRPSGYTLSFVGGMSKLKLNGETVKESVQLKDFDTIELGPLKAQFTIWT